MANDWNVESLGDLRGKYAVVTGANSGIGFHTALELGRAGAEVVVACRDPERGKEAIERMRHEAPAGKFSLEVLDLASLSSVRAFAEKYLATGKPIDLLVNNAGVMAVPTRETTVDGFERQLGTNHLGHFALTGLLLPALKQSRAPRVVSVSSGVAMWGKVVLDDLNCDKRYAPMRAYGQSKLANLFFMLELGKRAPWLTSVAAHPGGTQTNLQKHAFKWSIKLMGQPADVGALPSLRAAVEPTQSGHYFGPKSLFNMRGAPIEVKLPRTAKNEATAGALWEASVKMTGVRF